MNCQQWIAPLLRGTLLALMTLSTTSVAYGQSQPSAAAPESATGRLVVRGQVTDASGAPVRSREVKFLLVQANCDCRSTLYCRFNCRKCCPRAKPVTTFTNESGEINLQAVAEGGVYSLVTTDDNVDAQLDKLRVEPGTTRAFAIPQGLLKLFSGGKDSKAVTAPAGTDKPDEKQR
ncbi:MAG: hypothetical protein M3416_16265 [Acidobacteriota bacterium]|nr:hypothetical protein [Acidobacteriota bacterium]